MTKEKLEQVFKFAETFELSVTLVVFVEQEESRKEVLLDFCDWYFNHVCLDECHTLAYYDDCEEHYKFINIDDIETVIIYEKAIC